MSFPPLASSPAAPVAPAQAPLIQILGPVARPAMEMDPTSEEAWLRRGAQAMKEGRNRLAARCFARVMLLAPDRAPAMHNLAEALRLCGRKQQAAIAFTRALRLRPAYPRALAAFGDIRKSGD